MHKKKKAKMDKSSDDRGYSLGLNQETKNGIWGIACLGLALIAVLAYFGRAGTGGEIFRNFSVKLFGWGIFLVPVAFVMLGVAFLKDIHRRIYRSALLGTLLFVLSFLGIFFILRDGDFDARLLRGGYLGVVLGYPLLTGVGFLASLVVFLILIVVSVLIALNIPLYKLIPWWDPDSEEKDSAQEQPPTLHDNVVIKRGSQIIDAKAEESILPSKTMKNAPVHAALAKTDEEKDFVIKV